MHTSSHWWWAHFWEVGSYVISQYVPKPWGYTSGWRVSESSISCITRFRFGPAMWDHCIHWVFSSLIRVVSKCHCNLNWVLAEVLFGWLILVPLIDPVYKYWCKFSLLLSSPGLLQVKVQMNSGSGGRGWESRGWPRLGITPGVQETDWVQQQRSSIDPLRRFQSDGGNKGQE